MTTCYSIAVTVLLASLFGGMYRVLRGPTPGDRMLAGQLLGTIAVGVLLLVGQIDDDASTVDVALAFAALAAVSMVAFVRRAWRVEALDDLDP